MGRGRVTVLKSGREEHFAPQQSFPLAALGPFRPPAPASGLPSEVWEEALAAQAAAEITRPPLPAEVAALVEARQAARVRRDWAAADDLRQQIAALGWSVLDTPGGPQLDPK